jgi:hypothetical protein
VGACNIVLGAQGEPGFPKFSDTDGWASELRIAAAIRPTAARAINSLFLIYPPNPPNACRLFTSHRRTFQANPNPRNV